MTSEYFDWVRQISEKLEVFAHLELGYPHGDNQIWPPSADQRGEIDDGGLKEKDRKALAEFYSVCDGFELPDIAEGIFFNKRARVGVPKDGYVPSIVEGQDWRVLALGSFHDGSLIAMRSDTGEILKLPPSKIERNEYCENPRTPIRSLAPNLRSFLDQVLGAIPVSPRRL